jgi:hypothetical protein
MTTTTTTTTTTPTTTAKTTAGADLLICTAAGIAVAPAPLTKVCGKCHLDLSIARFNRERRKRDGFSAWCKACKSKDQTRRRVEQLQDDDDWVLRRKTSARLARAIARGEVEKPRCCPWCGQSPAPREIQAWFADPADPLTVIWRCRSCALAQAGKAQLAICRWCQEPFATQRTTVRRGGGRYCSVRCRNDWMKTTAEHVRQVSPANRSTAESVFVDDRF